MRKHFLVLPPFVWTEVEEKDSWQPITILISPVVLSSLQTNDAKELSNESNIWTLLENNLLIP